MGAETRLPFAVDEAWLGGAEGGLWAVSVSCMIVPYTSMRWT